MRPLSFLTSIFFGLIASTGHLAAEESTSTEMEIQQPEAAAVIMVPMRDGVKLSTEIFIPEEGARNLPCILIRTPYPHDYHGVAYGSMADWGYVVAVQSTRGSGKSEGRAVHYLNDGWGQL